MTVGQRASGAAGNLIDRLARPPGAHDQRVYGAICSGSEADRDRPVGLPPLARVVSCSAQRERCSRVADACGLVHPASMTSSSRFGNSTEAARTGAARDDRHARPGALQEEGRRGHARCVAVRGWGELAGSGTVAKLRPVDDIEPLRLVEVAVDGGQVHVGRAGPDLGGKILGAPVTGADEQDIQQDPRSPSVA